MTKLARAAACFLCCVPFAAQALGLGSLQVKSALYEPLVAEITLTSVNAQELKTLEVTLASHKEFQDASIQYLPFHSGVKFDVKQKQNGQHYLAVSTETPVREPFVQLLIRAKWIGGEVLREYSGLIDPPYLSAERSFTAAPPPQTPAIQEPAAPEPQAQGTVTTAPAPVTAPAIEQAKQEPETKAEATTVAPETLPTTTAKRSAAPTGLLGPSNAGDSGSAIAGESPRRVVRPMLNDGFRTAVATNRGNIGADWQAGDYRVKRGDTLWEIAERVRRDRSISIEQTIMAIYQNNRHAFFRDNVNNLKTGAVLDIPERQAVQSVGRQEARREFVAQYDVWKEYKLRLAATQQPIQVADETQQEKPSTQEMEVAQNPVEQPAPAVKKPAAVEKKPEPAPKPTATAKKPAETKPVEAKKEEKQPKATETASQQSDAELLKIVRSVMDKKDGAQAESEDTAEKEQQALAERASTLDESLASKQMEQAAASQKADRVQKQIENQARLIEIENKNLAQAQKETNPNAATKPPAPKTTPPPAATQPKPAPQQQPKMPTRPKPQVRDPLAEEMDKGLVDNIMEAVSNIGIQTFAILGGVIFLVVAILFLHLYRRKKSLSEFEENVLSSTSARSDVSTAGSDLNLPSTTGDTSLGGELTQAGMGHIHTDEVDPIAEAEVFIAYGRFEQAEEMLKNAAAKDPQRHELKLKLLEIYEQQNNVAAFETVAEELYGSLGGNDNKIWPNVEKMGHKLNPDNPMFSGGAGAGDKQMFSPPPSPPPTAATAPEPAAAPTAAPETPEPAAEATATEPDISSGVDFSPGSVETNEASPPPAAEAAPSADSGEDVDLDFNLDFGSSTTPPSTDDVGITTPEEASLTEGPDFSGINFDIGEASTDAEETADADIEMASDSSIDEVSFESEPAADEADAVSLDSEMVMEGEDDLDAAEAAPIEMELGADETAGLDEQASSGDEGQEGQANWDENATKLDLAKAYIDMGDTEGARSILDEVRTQGSPEQKQQADALAAQIG